MVKDGDWVDDLKRKQATKNQQELVTGRYATYRKPICQEIGM